MWCDLPRVVLDDELLVELLGHLLAPRKGGDGPGKLLGVDAEPVGDLRAAHVLLRELERLLVPARLTHLDAVPGSELHRGDVGRAAVDREVAVADQLARLRPAGREAHAEDDVVETRLEQLQEVLAGHAWARLGTLEVRLELPLEDA